MIELAILGLLSEQDLHGYELKKQLAELLGPWSSVSFGSLYPALARLEKAGRVKAVEAHTLDEPATPMTGALSGELAAFRTRLTGKAAGRTAPSTSTASTKGSKPSAKGATNRRGKKVYGLTAAGRERLHDLLTEDGPDDERTFGVRVAFCAHLDPAERIELFERRRAELLAQLATRRKLSRAETRAAAASTGASGGVGRRSDLYRRSLRDRDTRTLTNDLAWLDELLAATRGNLDGASAAALASAEPAGDPTLGSAAATTGAGHQPRRHLTDPALHAPTATFAPSRVSPTPLRPGPTTHVTAPTPPTAQTPQSPSIPPTSDPVPSPGPGTAKAGNHR